MRAVSALMVPTICSGACWATRSRMRRPGEFEVIFACQAHIGEACQFNTGEPFFGTGSGDCETTTVCVGGGAPTYGIQAYRGRLRVGRRAVADGKFDSVPPRRRARLR